MKGESATPETTLAVLLGASEFPKQLQLTPSKAFSRSASELKEYFLSSEGLALPVENVLDLFDSDKASDAIDEELALFLDRRQEDLKTRQLTARDVIVYYVGHGGFSSPGNAYFLALRATRAGNEYSSSYAIITLANTLRERATFLRKYLILDSCFSAAAQATFQSAPLEVAKQQTLEEFPGKGTALLCAAGPKDPAKSLPEQVYTMFSGALLDSLRKGSSERPDKLSLLDVTELTRSLIKAQFPDKAVRPELHSPDQKQGDVVVLPFFPNPARRLEAVASGRLQALWDAFDPSKLHCLIVASEHETKTPPSWTLDDLVAAALNESGQYGGEHQRRADDANPRIWDAFRACCDGTQLVSGSARKLAARFEAALVRQGTLSINRALRNPEALREAVRVVVEADVAIFDVTGFEPGAMLLLGVRAACRRGVTLCSHGNQWREGQPLDVPFNLKDLNIGSHTPREPGTGANPVVQRFVDRVVAGFGQLQKRPNYLDLPAYDALRQLGSDMEASALIPTSRRVLVLCPYEKDFFSNWEALITRLSTSLSTRHNIRPEITRVIDLPTPQMVSQSIYEQMRRAAACIADWSAYNPSVFVEFGVRLAASEWGAVAIVDPQFVERSDDPLAKTRTGLDQVAQLGKLFGPIEYSRQNQQRAAFDKTADALANRNPRIGADLKLSIVHDAAWRAAGVVSRVSPPVFAELGAAADALSHAERGEVEAPQILFYESIELKVNSEDAATERRIAAWLYLHKREDAGALPADDPRRKIYLELGQAAAAALYAQSDRRPESLDLAMYIEEQINRPIPGAGSDSGRS